MKLFHNLNFFPFFITIKCHHHQLLIIQFFDSYTVTIQGNSNYSKYVIYGSAFQKSQLSCLGVSLFRSVILLVAKV